MRSSTWHALGNAYLLVEQAELSPDDVRGLVGDADGIVQVVSWERDSADVVIWNPDGSTAEMSGNGTRIAARWLAERWGVEVVRIRVADREVVARIVGGGQPVILLDQQVDVAERVPLRRCHAQPLLPAGSRRR